MNIQNFNKLEKESEWLNGLRNGDNHSFEQIYNHYAPLLVKYAAKYKIVDHIRKQSHRRFYKEVLSQSFILHPNTSYNGMDDVIFHDLKDKLDERIQKLPTRTRETFLLSRYHHMIK